MREHSTIHACDIVRSAAVLAFAVSMISVSQPVFAEPGAYAECTGQLLDASSNREISFQELADRTKSADYVIFGERHGVRQQATASACVLSAMADTERPAALVLEMLSRDDDQAVARYRREHPESPAGLGAALKWWTRGWPAFDNWLPLIERAFSLRVPITGGDLPVEGKNATKLTEKEKKQFQLQLGAAQTAIHASWKRAMTDAHCGMISDEQAARNAEQQIRRDLSMADAGQKAAKSGMRVLLQVGRGHSRTDRSLYTALRHSGAKVLSLGAFVEGETISDEDRTRYDLIWIAGKYDGKDPCAVMGKIQKSEEGPAR